MQIVKSCFWKKNKNNNMDLSSAEFAHRMVKVSIECPRVISAFIINPCCADDKIADDK